MRREGYELQVGQPQVIYKTINDVRCEPIEELTISVPEELKRKAATETGGQVGSCQLSFTGICEACMNQQNKEKPA